MQIELPRMCQLGRPVDGVPQGPLRNLKGAQRVFGLRAKRLGRPWVGGEDLRFAALLPALLPLNALLVLQPRRPGL